MDKTNKDPALPAFILSHLLEHATATVYNFQLLPILTLSPTFTHFPMGLVDWQERSDPIGNGPSSSIHAHEI